MLAKGINAGPGAATGKIVLPRLGRRSRSGSRTTRSQLILVRRETSPEDLRGMKVAKGILTAFGGASSHAALVSRQMGKVCIVGCGDLNIDYHAGTRDRRRQGAQGRRLHLASTASPAKSSRARSTTQPSEVVQVLIDKTLKPRAVGDLSALRSS